MRAITRTQLTKCIRVAAASAGSFTVLAPARCDSGVPAFKSDFTGDDIPSANYKAHFTQAYDAQAASGAKAANVAARYSEERGDTEIRTTIARTLMRRLNYTDEELEVIGKEDMLKMQGVGSPFPLAGIEPGDAVLDLGSGFGIDAFLAASKAGPRGQVVGIDLSAEEVVRAQARAEERGLVSTGRCKFVKADMEELPFENAVFDKIISNGGFCLVPNKKKAFEEMYRVLKPGGRFAVSCTALKGPLPPLTTGKRWPPCMEVFLQKDNVRSIVESVGFHTVGVDDKNSTMDVWDLEDSEMTEIAKQLGGADGGGGGCSHAKKAAERRAKESVVQFLESGREAGVHWGNPEFDHIQDFDMNKLCARIVITAQKPLI